MPEVGSRGENSKTVNESESKSGQNTLTYEDFKLDDRLKDSAKQRLRDPNLNPLIKQICCGKIVKEKDIECLKKAGKGGFGDVFIVDENFVVKRVLKYQKGMLNPLDK